MVDLVDVDEAQPEAAILTSTITTVRRVDRLR
jgi:hypothetical protein